MQDHILIITDSKEHELLLKKKLPKASLIFVESGHFDSDKVSSLLKFAFIIFDESEGKENTFKMVRMVRENENTSHVPILVISGKMNKDYLEKLLRIGVSNIIPTPLRDEDVAQILAETKKTQTTNEIITSIKLPETVEHKIDIHDHEVIDLEAIAALKKAFVDKKRITIALVEAKEKPHMEGVVIISVTKELFCIVSLEKNGKQMYDELSRDRPRDLFAGILSTENNIYKDIASMLIDARAVLSRAKETPNGISFYNQV